ncbi:MAG: tetratricopeptide repeat protein [Acidimicrobiia bacterium]|nr:tetratricopeptide repeat protein [Acidimicrobiia bacterium]
MADVTDATFQTAVVDRSNEVPVVVDLWAEWCGPCKTLTPILEKVIADTGGRVELAKINVDENPGVSQAFKVQSIPAVYAMKDGAVVDGFMGAQAEPVVAEFVQKLVPTAEQTAVELLLAAGDEASLLQAIDLEPDNADVVVALAEIWVTSDRAEQALELLAKIPETSESRRIAALARTGPAPGGDEADAKLGALLGRVKDDDAARQEFVDLLEVMGPDDPRTASWRKRLTNALF